MATSNSSAPQPPRRILFSKTDALGDQLLASGLVKELLAFYQPEVVLWFVRSGYEFFSVLLHGTSVFRADMSQPVDKEIRRLLSEVSPADTSIWSRVVLVPVPFDPYSAAPTHRDRIKDVS